MISYATNIEDMHLDKSITCCFTGGRPKSLFPDQPYNRAYATRYTDLVWNLTEYLETLYAHGYRNFVSGGAQGFDQCAFQAVHNLKNRHPDVKNFVFVPFEHQDARWMNTGLFSKYEYQNMLHSADAVFVVNKTLDPRIAPYHETCKALFARNDAMLSVSNLVIGQYPNDTWKQTSQKGGTAGCLRSACQKQIEIVVHDFRNSL